MEKGIKQNAWGSCEKWRNVVLSRCEGEESGNCARHHRCSVRVTPKLSCLGVLFPLGIGFARMEIDFNVVEWLWRDRTFYIAILLCTFMFQWAALMFPNLGETVKTVQSWTTARRDACHMPNSVLGWNNCRVDAGASSQVKSKYVYFGRYIIYALNHEHRGQNKSNKWISNISSNLPTLDQTMTWHPIGTKPLPEPKNMA